MTGRVEGEFDVKLEAQGPDWEGQPDMLGRRLIDKRFHGALDAVSRGQMLWAAGGRAGSAGYVAIERVTGALDGRQGSFVLQHNATMDREAPYQNIIVVPDSGTDELTGLSGAMSITIVDGRHFYGFDYQLPDTPA